MGLEMLKTFSNRRPKQANYFGNRLVTIHISCSSLVTESVTTAVAAQAPRSPIDSSIRSVQLPRRPTARLRPPRLPPRPAPQLRCRPSSWGRRLPTYQPHPRSSPASQARGGGLPASPRGMRCRSAANQPAKQSRDGGRPSSPPAPIFGLRLETELSGWCSFGFIATHSCLWVSDLGR